MSEKSCVVAACVNISRKVGARKWLNTISISLRDRKLYHPNNAALGMAAMRAGVNHWQAGLIEVGHGMVCKAYAILLVTHGPTHPITKDLEVNPRFSQLQTFTKLKAVLSPRLV